jgi:hypothetical protein
MAPERDKKRRIGAILSAEQAPLRTAERISPCERRKQHHYMRDLFSLEGEKWSSVL